MYDAFHLAQLSSEQHDRIDQLEKELDVVLIAWEPTHHKHLDNFKNDEH
ncbi:hypothetical protein [Bacillus kexueae]|nr:hypothetical protein [Bacillus kexueae]